MGFSVVNFVPVLVSPIGNIATTTPTYTWNALTNATDYQLLVVDSVGGVMINQVYTAAQAGCTTGTGTCGVTPAVTLPGDASYNWNVRGKKAGSFGSYSAAKAFTVIISPKPSTPALIAPNGVVTVADLRPTYQWSAQTGALNYQLYVVDRTGVVVTNLFFTASEAGCAGGTGTCSLKPATTLTDSTTYFWNVRAKNLAGFSSWSSAGWLTPTTKNAPATAPTLQSPIGTGTTHPTYSWSAVTDATDYQIMVSGAGGTVVNQIVSAATAGCSGGGTCSFTPAPTLTAGQTYNWNVRAKNLVGVGPWSPASMFKAQ
jgi:hypothetical protein